MLALTDDVAGCLRGLGLKSSRGSWDGIVVVALHVLLRLECLYNLLSRKAEIVKLRIDAIDG